MINLNSIQKDKRLENINQDLDITKKYFEDFLEKNEKSKIEVRVLEFSNYIDFLEKEKLNGQNGYYLMRGIDAIRDKSCAKKVFEEILDLVNQKQKELKLKEGYGLKIAEATKAKKMNTILKGIISHEMNQTLNWEVGVIEEAKQNAINKGVLYRDNKNDLALALQNGKTVILYKGKLLNSKIDEIKAELSKFESDFYTNVIMAYAKEKNAKAKEFFEEHREKLNLYDVEKLEKIVQEIEKNCVIDETAKSLFNLYSNDEKALKKEIEKTKKYRDEIKSEVELLLDLKNQSDEKNQDEILKEFFGIVQTKQKENQSLDLKDIPLGLNFENQTEAKKYIDEINKNGFIKTNDFVFLNLLGKFENPEKFKKSKLQKYKFYLSEEDFVLIQNHQKEKNIELKDIFELVKKGIKKIKDESNKADLARKILNDFEEGKNSKDGILNIEEKQKLLKARINAN